MNRDLVSQLKDYFDYLDEAQGAVDVLEAPFQEPAAPVRSVRPRRGLPAWVYAVAATAVVLLAVGGVALWAGVQGEIAPVVTEPATPTTEATVTTAATPTTTGPTTTVPSFTTESGVLHLAAEALTDDSEVPLLGVDVRGDLAFVGGMSVGYYSPKNVGVRIVDLSDPENPELAGRIPLRHDSYFPYDERHGHGDAVVTTLATPSFSGDVAIVLDGVPNSYDGANYPEVFGLWDVTGPSDPQFLDAVISLGSSALGQGTSDLSDKPHDSKAVSGPYFFTLYDADARVRPGSYYAGGIGDVFMGVVDISNPAEPAHIADWQDDPKVYLVGLSLNEAGTRAYVTGRWLHRGYLYIIDVQNPAVPTLLGSYNFPLRSLPSAITKAVPFADESYVLLLDHSWNQEKEGIVLILDITDLNDIRQVAEFDPENPPQAQSETREWRIAHDVVVRGNLAFVSWLQDGVRAIDVSDPLNPVQVGQFDSLYPVHPTDPPDTSPSLSDVALLGDRYVVATTVYGPRMYVLEVLEESNRGEARK